MEIVRDSERGPLDKGTFFNPCLSARNACEKKATYALPCSAQLSKELIFKFHHWKNQKGREKN